MSGSPPDESPSAPAVEKDGPDAQASTAASDGDETTGEVTGVEGDGVTGPPTSARAVLAATDEPRRKSIRARVFGRTDVGQVREHNEDNFLIADLNSGRRGINGDDTKDFDLGTAGLLLAVCDGMGGAAAGEVASKLATDIIYNFMMGASGPNERDRLAFDIVKALEEAGTRILAEANSNRACRGMGTTATVAALLDDHLLLGQVGDSRAYVLRKDRLVQVTRDQSLVNQLIEAGQLTEEEAENFEHSNIILQALGTADAVQVDLTYVKLTKGDMLLMCSDGLSGMVKDGAIRQVLARRTDPVQTCRTLIDDANQAGGHDNITVITAVFEGEGLEDADDALTAALKYQKYKLPAWVDDHAHATSKRAALNLDSVGDAPSIEIHGEFEVDADMDWSELVDERGLMSRKPAADGSRVFILALLFTAAVLVYFLFLRR